jgi:hypothetical protein
MSEMRIGTCLVVATSIITAVPARASIAMQAQTVDVVVRAVGEMPSKELVEKLGMKALPKTVIKAEYPDYEKLTAGQVASLMCGKLQEGYLDVLLKINGLKERNLVEPLGDKAYLLKWPACFQVRENIRYNIRKNDNWTAIRMQFTGEFANGPGLVAYFNDSGAPYSPKTKLAEGAAVRLPFQTFRTKVSLPASEAAAIIAELNSTGGRTIRVDDRLESRGKLIGPVSGTVQGADADCEADTAEDNRYPFNALEIANAYNYLKASQQTIFVAIVDNGFFGVPCSPGKCPSDASAESDFSVRFPKAFFATQDFYVSHKANLGVDYVLGPLNYPALTAADVNDVSGHGTHVAGLVLGGPTYLPLRSQLIDPASGEARIALSIVAVSRGKLDLDSEAEGRIGTAIAAMRRPMVVNMSIAFDDQDSEATFKRLFETSGTLFVVAAGNGSTNLDEQRAYPAALGGQGSTNVITVTSIDSNREISAFANYGSAVDIAAPGCRISSWLDAEGEDVPISGTSQAAPLVTFASALLMSKWPAAKPQEIKNRLIYSGDLIRSGEGRLKVWSWASLAIPKALFLKQDFLFVREGNGYAAYLGDVDRFSGVTCKGSPRLFDDIRSIKRINDRAMAVYTAAGTGPVRVCSGRLAEQTDADATVANVISFRPKAKVVGASITDLTDGKIMTVPASQVVELIKSY